MFIFLENNYIITINDGRMSDLLYKIQTELGDIAIEKSVVRKIVAECIAEFDGKVILTNHKGQRGSIASKIGAIDENSQIIVTNKNDEIEIKLNIVIKFGTSISLVTDKIINDIKKSVKEIVGKEDVNITIIVVGIMGKKLTKRNIEVTG